MHCPLSTMDLIFTVSLREESSNNRVKSGYEGRRNAPIDQIPDAGARSGTSNGQETTTPGLSFLTEDTGPSGASSSNS